MDITSMVYFITVCNYKNVTKAADHLHISQSALSRRLQAMENELDISLLDRSRGNVVLTPAGKIFLEEAQKVVRDNDSLLKHLDKCRYKDSLRIGFSYYLYLPPFIELMSKVQKEFPQKMIHFRESRSGKLLDEFFADDLDIIYTSLGDVDGLPGVEYHTLIENDLAILVPRGHRLWNNSVIYPEDLNGENLCVALEQNRYKISTSRIVLNELEMTDILNQECRIIEECSSSTEMLLYVCTLGCLGLTGIFGNSDKSQYPDKVRSIRLAYKHVNYGDQVLAWKMENEEAGSFIKKLIRETSD